MKTFKTILALTLSLMMVLALCVPALAVSDTDITINKAINGATYSAYRLLETTTSLKVQGCHATDAEHLSTCYNVAYSVNDKYADLLKTETGKSSETDIIEYIQSLTSAEAIRTFADDMYAAISASNPALPADKTVAGANGTAVLDNVDQGYWLIVETISDDDYAGAYSLVMLDTAGSRDIAIETKRDEPGLIKNVRDNGMSYGHGADMQIGDDAEFLLITDVPNPIGYDAYTYIIHDQMGEGLTFNADSVKILLNSVTGSELATSYYSVIADESICTDCDFHISVNIKAATAAGILKGDDRLYIMYTAKLNENANVLVDGTNTDNANPNTAWLEYSNDPYDENETTVSADMTVYVWTFPLELNKVDSAGTALTGAKFVLSLDANLTETDLKDGTDNNSLPDGYEKMIPLFLVSGTKNTYRVAPEGYTGDVVYEIEVGSAVLQGFDDQVEYYLYETAAPAGYNQLNAPVSFKFFAQYQSSESPLFATGYPKVSINAGAESSTLKADIENNTGAELPSTGGIGTTLFYVFGGLLVAGAAVLLITKKRMGTEK